MGKYLKDDIISPLLNDPETTTPRNIAEKLMQACKLNALDDPAKVVDVGAKVAASLVSHVKGDTNNGDTEPVRVAEFNSRI